MDGGAFDDSQAVGDGGSSDVRQGGTALTDRKVVGAGQGRIEATLDAVKPAQQVLWLNVQTAPDYPAGAEQVNVALEDAAQSRGNVRIVDFSDEFAGHPEWLTTTGGRTSRPRVKPPSTTTTIPTRPRRRPCPRLP